MGNPPVGAQTVVMFASLLEQGKKCHLEVVSEHVPQQNDGQKLVQKAEGHDDSGNP